MQKQSRLERQPDDRDRASELHQAPGAQRPTLAPWWAMLFFSHMSLMRGTARLDARGRLVLPAELRRRLGLHAGDEVRITEEADGALRVETRSAAAHALIGLAGTSDESAVDELTAERHREAEVEEHEARRFRSGRRVRRRE